MSSIQDTRGNGARRRYLSSVLVVVIGAGVLALGAPDAVAADVVVAPVADSRVLQASPTVNTGTASRLDVDNPGEQSYLRFNVTGVTGTVESATLRLFVRNGSANAPKLFFTDNTWTETGITWNNKPAAIGAAIADVTTATSGTWSEYDLTGDITGNGTYDLVLLPDGSDGIQYDSREGTTPPQLVVTSGGGPTNAPPVAGDDTATTPADTPVTINVAANDTDPNGNLNPNSATTTCTGCATPTNGTLTNNANGTFTYTPTTGFTGTDNFTYQICDTDNACDTATVTINVNTVSAPQMLAAAADSRVLQASPTVNSGTVNRLDVDSPGEQSYLRFNVTGVTGTVQSATLRLFVRNGSANAPKLFFTDNTWTETGITWNNKPAATGPAIADVTTATNGTWSEYDLT
ncbi:MAG: DNRLRE domain-containing protein, partial [Acidimicrobiales bacterium]